MEQRQREESKRRQPGTGMESRQTSRRSNRKKIARNCKALSSSRSRSIPLIHAKKKLKEKRRANGRSSRRRRRRRRRPPQRSCSSRKSRSRSRGKNKNSDRDPCQNMWRQQPKKRSHGCRTRPTLELPLQLIRDTLRCRISLVLKKEKEVPWTTPCRQQRPLSLARPLPPPHVASDKVAHRQVTKLGCRRRPQPRLTLRCLVLHMGALMEPEGRDSQSVRADCA
mmetsp:Transcript_51168/g.108730  ORF Transcript_51168/g.108730 Transcript_51168/m.108730 type:complete len:224 (-) Transcript_51168:80-751(-)